MVIVGTTQIPSPVGQKERTASAFPNVVRSEEHTSELQSLAYLVCRLLLEKKKKPRLTSPLRSGGPSRCLPPPTRRLSQSLPGCKSRMRARNACARPPARRTSSHIEPHRAS